MKRKKSKLRVLPKVPRQTSLKPSAGSSAAARIRRRPGRPAKVDQKATVKVDESATLKASRSSLDPKNTPINLKLLPGDFWVGSGKAQGLEDLADEKKLGRFVVCGWDKDQDGEWRMVFVGPDLGRPQTWTLARAKRWNTKQAAYKFLNKSETILAGSASVLNLDSVSFPLGE